MITTKTIDLNQLAPVQEIHDLQEGRIKGLCDSPVKPVESSSDKEEAVVRRENARREIQSLKDRYGLFLEYSRKISKELLEYEGEKVGLLQKVVDDITTELSKYAQIEAERLLEKTTASKKKAALPEPVGGEFNVFRPVREGMVKKDKPEENKIEEFKMRCESGEEWAKKIYDVLRSSFVQLSAGNVKKFDYLVTSRIHTLEYLARIDYEAFLNLMEFFREHGKVESEKLSAPLLEALFYLEKYARDEDKNRVHLIPQDQNKTLQFMISGNTLTDWMKIIKLGLMDYPNGSGCAWLYADIMVKHHNGKKRTKINKSGIVLPKDKHALNKLPKEERTRKHRSSKKSKTSFEAGQATLPFENPSNE